MIKKYYRIIIITLTLISYLSVFVPPAIFWPAGFVALTIPLFVLYHLIGVVFRLRKTFKQAFWQLAMLLLGLPFLSSSISISVPRNDKGTFEVLSYNVRIFNNYEHLQAVAHGTPNDMIKWLEDNNAEIMCLQEYYTKPGSKTFDVTTRLRRAGWKGDKVLSYYKDGQGGQYGLAIFTRAPFIRSGIVKNPKGEEQRAIYIDIIQNGDTVRVYNMHLQSMRIDEENVVNSEKLKTKYKDLVGRLKSGFVRRSDQIDCIMKHVNDSPYPVVMCGDLNEVPYSYVYNKIKGPLKNAFEKKGLGLGFTYNGKLPFLRIDNQFFHKSLQICRFKTLRKIKYSDHFPIVGYYRMNKSNGLH